MKSFLRSIAAIAVVAFAGSQAAPAGAVLATDFTPAKLRTMGKTAVPIAGSGVVILKVLVKADGSFQVQNVIKSSNPADNAAALDIARHSTYRVALRGGKPATTFYDFTLRFSGKSVVGTSDSQGGTTIGGTGGSQSARIGAMLHRGDYRGTKAAATAYLAAHPNDDTVNSYLGIADSFLNDEVSAATAFDKVSQIPSGYVTIAAQTYSVAAIKSAPQNPQQALAFAQKAMKLHADSNAYFALGYAQLRSGDAAASIPNLRKAHDLTFASSKSSVKDKLAVDMQLVQAYLQVKDTANEQAVLAEAKQLDPSNTSVAGAIAQAYYSKANTEAQANNTADAIKDFEAGALADPTHAVTGYANAALLYSHLEKPDYNGMNADADKALAAKSDDALANYAKGVAMVNLGVANKDDATKKKGIEYLNKADAEAKAANLIGLATSIENFIKSIK